MKEIPARSPARLEGNEGNFYQVPQVDPIFAVIDLSPLPPEKERILDKCQNYLNNFQPDLVAEK